MLHRIEKWVDRCFACLPRPRPNRTSTMNARLIAHRGAHDQALGILENTHGAFERALTLGCYGIEFDVHACADGVLIVNHDPTLKRLWGHDVAISSLNFPELRQLAPLVPSLAEVIAQYGKRLHLFIELKAPFTALQPLADTLQTLTPCVDYHLISLDEQMLPTLTLFPKPSFLLVPVHNNVNAFCKLSLQQRYGGVLGHYLLLNNRQVNELELAQQMAGVGFVDSKFSLYRELNRGISFLFSNDVATTTKCLQALREFHARMP